MRIQSAADLEQLDFAKGGGLVPVVTQHARTGEVLMVAYADQEALQRSLDQGVMWYYSRSRQQLWRKGETSGHGQHLVSLHGDCDADTVLARVEPTGPSCHTGAWSCFGAPPVLPALAEVLEERARTPQPDSYTTRLLGNPNLRLKKLGEEAVELAVACTAGDAESAAAEAADLLYHTLVAALGAGATLDHILAVLAERRGAGTGDAR